MLGPEVVTGWAMPCVPYGGQKNQGFFCIPEVGAGVWVEFEEGDLEFPIWVGTFWSEPGGNSEIPTINDADGKERKNDADAKEPKNEQQPPTRKILKTNKGHTIQFEDADGEEMVIIVEATHKHVVTLNKDGIQITDGVNGNKIILGKDGIQIGSSGASEPFVLGKQFMANVKQFLDGTARPTPIRVRRQERRRDAPIPLPPAPSPLTLEVPLSAKHKVEIEADGTAQFYASDFRLL